MSEINTYEIIDTINDNLTLLLLSVNLNDIVEFKKIIDYFESLEESDLVSKKQLAISVSRIMRAFTLNGDNTKEEFMHEALGIVSSKPFLNVTEMNITQALLGIYLELINKATFRDKLNSIIIDETVEAATRRNALNYLISYSQMNDTYLSLYKDLVFGDLNV